MAYDQYLNIPQELRDIPQWVASGANKEPINPKTGFPASVNKPETWGTFLDAIYCNTQGLGQGLGFVFTEQDPYVFIDLDNPFDPKHDDWTPEYRQRCREINDRIYYSLLNITYTEISQSGGGVHIIVRGSIPNGRRKDAVEIYGSGRYAIFTGISVGANVIADCSVMVTNMHDQMDAITNAAEFELVNVEATRPDEQIIEMALRGDHSGKLSKLLGGEWDGDYPSGSEADLALLSILCHYTKSNEQVRRIYDTATKLSQRIKNGKKRVTDSYFNRTLTRVRASQPPDVDLSGLQLNGHNGTPVVPQIALVGPTTVSVSAGSTMPTTVVQQEWTLPEGLLGRIAQYIHASSHYQLKAAAIAGAIGLMAGIAGRAYNINESGLNHYVMLLAPSGSGKESMARGIDTLLRLVRANVPMANTFKGPAVFSSGQGLLKVVNNRPCFISVLGEFGITLQQICSPRANGADQMSRKVLLDLYGKSGLNGVLDEMAYSDRDKNTSITYMPSVSILGESVAEQFYAGLDAVAVTGGLLPRFIIFETQEETFDRNRNAKKPPDSTLITDLQKLCSTALTMASNNSVHHVEMDEGGQYAMDEFERYCSNRRKEGRHIDKELWNRAHLKAMRLSALIAIGCNIDRPVITQSMVEWTANVVMRTTERVLERFDNDEVGEGEAQQDSDFKKAVDAYLKMTPSQRMNGNAPRDCVFDEIIPYAFLRKWLRQRSSFRNSRMPLDKAVVSIIQEAVKMGHLIPISPQKKIELGIRSDAWYINNVR